MTGSHPIDPDTARILAGGVSAWNRVLTDPITGAVLAVDRYRPSEDLKRLLHARDSRCRFPGCNLPANELDLDHTRDAAHGGPTTLGNLAGLCRRHHVLKHQSRWTVRQVGLPNRDAENDGPRATIAQRMGLKIGAGAGAGPGNGTGTGNGFRPPHGPGILEWTSLTGRKHHDHPPTPATHTRQPRMPAGPERNHPDPSHGGAAPRGSAPGNSDPPPF
ncbi:MULTISPECIES: HNH endonuclease signature motif containing protein [Arthrobacter]|uniref:HNH endonuclease signature motif containing protein n=2 Tax=Arthrobacter TaxID=1663 RepID=A0ABU9KK63_9MICC|nr:HNH endonuclease signature motif containing protein [Arthrobacter sp. YJM1]MDP5227290.1 HNH endonuclease signature motif containing protein [Arthrobacter sp. YJM1]